MTAQQLSQAIANEFVRLNLSVRTFPYSGLTVQASEDSEDANSVTIYDDYADGDYSGEAVLAYLKTLKAEDVSLNDENNVWELIRCFEV